MSVNHSARSEGIIGIFWIFFDMKVCNVFSLEWPHRDDTKEFTQYTSFNIKKIKGHRPSVTRRLKRDTNCSPLILFQNNCMAKT